MHYWDLRRQRGVNQLRFVRTRVYGDPALLSFGHWRGLKGFLLGPVRKVNALRPDDFRGSLLALAVFLGSLELVQAAEASIDKVSAFENPLAVPLDVRQSFRV